MSRYIEDKGIKLSSGNLFKQYLLRTIGRESFIDLVKYEILTSLFGPLPGAIGLKLRNASYKFLLPNLGKGVILLPHVTLRGIRRINLEDYVLIDEYVILDVIDENSSGITIGESTFIERFSIVSSGIGDQAHVKIGQNCSLGPSVYIYGSGGVDIGNDVLIAGRTSIVASSHTFEDLSIPIRLQKQSVKGIRIEDNVWIGAGVTVLDGVTIGKGSVIGAGAVVNKDIPELSIAVGIPAKVIKRRNEK